MKRIYIPIIMLLSFAMSGQEEYSLNDQFREEIIQLSAHHRIKAAMDKVVNYEDMTVSNHITLTETEAPPFKEAKRAKLFKDMLEKTGAFDSLWVDAVGNVLALRKGTEGQRIVCLDAHLDTVFPEGTDVKVRLRNDTLYAPGIGDDTRGLAILVTVSKTLKEMLIRTRDDILVVGSVGEEGLGDLRGVKYLFGPNGPQIDSWISIDGGDLGRVYNKGLGSYRYRVTFKGPGGHSWGAFGLVNPHHALGDAINRFVERADQYTADGPRTSYNVGVISGGTSVNSIPFESIMEIDMRSVDPTRLDTMEQLLMLSIDEALINQNKRKRLGGELTVETVQIGNRPSGELSMSLPLIQRAIAATAYFGKRPLLTTGSTNSNIPISLGIPAVTIGRGGVGANAHSLNEWWLNKEGYKAVQLALLLLVAEAGFQS